MTVNIERDEFEHWMKLIREDVRGVHERLDALNGRTRENEQAIAVIQDRTDRSKGHAAAWGGSIGAAVAGLIEAAKWWVGR